MIRFSSEAHRHGHAELHLGGVDVDQVDAVRQSAQVLADRCQDIQLAVTGPWPPYSFVGVD